MELVKTRNGHSTNSATDTARTCTPAQFEQLGPSLAVAHVCPAVWAAALNACSQHARLTVLGTQTPQSTLARALPRCDFVIVHVVAICRLCPARERETTVLYLMLSCQTVIQVSCRPLS